MHIHIPHATVLSQVLGQLYRWSCLNKSIHYRQLCGLCTRLLHAEHAKCKQLSHTEHIASRRNANIRLIAVDAATHKKQKAEQSLMCVCVCGAATQPKPRRRCSGSVLPGTSTCRCRIDGNRLISTNGN